MNIDFHFGTIYVLARWRGFKQEDAYKIAFASQQVDDFTDTGAIYFKDEKYAYSFEQTAKTIDITKNLDDYTNRRAWVAHHFLPGRKDLRVITDSEIARELMTFVCAPIDRPHALHMLGAALHTYADTWAHQYFTGICASMNRTDGCHFDDEGERFKSKVVGAAFPCGHGMCLAFPDYTFREFNIDFVKDKDLHIRRKNYEWFVDAANHCYMWLGKFFDGEAKELIETQKEQLKKAFIENTSKGNDEEILAYWLRAIAAGHFTGIKETVIYDKNQWKKEIQASCGIEFDEIKPQEAITDESGISLKEILGWIGVYLQAPLVRIEVDKWNPDFLDSNFKHFADASSAIKYHILKEILPSHGICAG